ncbi:MAG: DUF1847 domain-containing protein [Eubacteriaceae bacterium]|nr:DUF1847 domain-containing protein [Eubacteriaceae bacterium]
MKEKTIRTCADCTVIACDGKSSVFPDFCITGKLDEKEKEKILEIYNEPENGTVMKEAACVEAEGYMQKTRVEEIIDFAGRLGAKKLGIATCVGLIRETRILTKILRKNGFEVYGVACKAGAVNKTKVGIDPKCLEVGENMCNPIMQAKILNEQATDLNIVMGLCVGHDSLFYKYSEALTTTLVTKDRVLGHNPVAALYTAESYYSRLMEK